MQPALHVSQYYVYYPLAIAVVAIAGIVVNRASSMWSYISFLVAVGGILLFVVKTV